MQVRAALDGVLDNFKEMRRALRAEEGASGFVFPESLLPPSPARQPAVAVPAPPPAAAAAAVATPVQKKPKLHLHVQVFTCMLCLQPRKERGGNWLRAGTR